MKKHFFIRANVLLGTLSLLLAGCHSTKKAAAPSQPEAPANNDQVGVMDDRVICMYGVPASVYEQQRAEEEQRMKEREQQRRDSLRADSVSSRPERVMLKYGVPYPRTEQQ